MQAIYSQLAITGQSLLFVFGKDSKAGRDRSSFIVKKKEKSFLYALIGSC